ncbi:MAG TPA: CsgG/HfaB family protein [Bacteroidota bacterium]|nr:CsgG/HfaB family protein [Bacteroidota bacterium]
MKYFSRLFLLSILAIAVTVPLHSQLKKRVAVARFEDRSGTGWHNIGDGVSDMLVTALVKSGSFSVLERQEMDKVVQEQQFSNSSMVTPETAAKLGKILGVELFVVGSVSEFGVKESSVGGGVSLFGASVSKRKARAVVDIRLVNVTTGEIIAAENQEGEESSTGVSARFEDIDFSNANSWDDTDIGKAARKAVDGCVELVRNNMEKIPWSGKILKINTDGTVLMKPGSEGNVKTGMEFAVYRVGEEIKDPDTGLSLGSEETKIGKIRVTEDMLKGKAAKATVIDGKDFLVGDIVREK